MNTFPINSNKRQFLDFGMELIAFESLVFITFIYVSLILSISSWPFVSLSWETFISSKSFPYIPPNGFTSTTSKRYQYPWPDLKKNHITNFSIIRNDCGWTYSLVFRISNADFEPDTMPWDNVNQSMRLFSWSSMLHYHPCLGQPSCASSIHALIYSRILCQSADSQNCYNFVDFQCLK
jgi:hypothetical protein